MEAIVGLGWLMHPPVAAALHAKEQSGPYCQLGDKPEAGGSLAEPVLTLGFMRWE